MSEIKIYFGSKTLSLTKSTKSNTEKTTCIKVTQYSEADLSALLHNFLHNKNTQHIEIQSKNPKKIFHQLKQHFNYIQAAGGIVKHKKRCLLIKRLGLWDLPKGKIEANESKSAAALREIAEETGQNQLQILKKIPSTHHIYPYKKGFALKKTHWYQMLCTSKQALVPQTQEGIEHVKWVKRKKAQHKIKKSYPSFTQIVSYM